MPPPLWLRLSLTVAFWPQELLRFWPPIPLGLPPLFLPQLLRGVWLCFLRRRRMVWPAVLPLVLPLWLLALRQISLPVLPAVVSVWQPLRNLLWWQPLQVGPFWLRFSLQCWLAWAQVVFRQRLLFWGPVLLRLWLAWPLLSWLKLVCSPSLPVSRLLLVYWLP